MTTFTKKHPAFLISDGERAMLEIVNRIGPCSTTQVHEHMSGKYDLLPIMRCMHMLVDRGLLKRVAVKGQLLYKVNPNYRMTMRNEVRVQRSKT